MNPKEWASIWKKSTSLLERVRINDIRNASVSQSIRNLDQAFKLTMNESSLRPGSGLIEMQKIFHKNA
jgi:hypothetical protein